MQDWEPYASLLEIVPTMGLAHFQTMVSLVLVALMQSSQPQHTDPKKNKIIHHYDRRHKQAIPTRQIFR
jgi:hypothetical protein